MQGIEVERLTRWLTEHVDGAVPPFTFELIEGGRSNLTFLVIDHDGVRRVLRRPPIGGVLATAHDMGREHRIVTAIGSTDVPVPRTLALCDDELVNGAPFYVMEFVEGVVLDSPERGELLSIELRKPTAEHLVDVLADLHAVDVDETGLGDLARRDGYIERQLRRWTRQWELSRTREMPAVDEVADRLSRRVPTQVGVSLTHGDYRFGNCLVDVEQARIASVLDWELSTLGDPLADLGYLGVYWAHADGDARQHDPTGLPGFPSFLDMVERYAGRTGRDVSQIGYYIAFSCWRLAVISEGVYRRFLDGAMGGQNDSEVVQQFKEGTEELAERALDAVRGLG